MNGGELTETSREAALDRVRESRGAFERLAASDLPIAPFARNALDALDEEAADE